MGDPESTSNVASPDTGADTHFFNTFPASNHCPKIAEVNQNVKA